MNNYLIYIALSFILSLASGFLIIPRIVDFCFKRKLYDVPNERKVHHEIIPRLGGMAFIPCMFFAFLVSIYVYNYNSGCLPMGISLWTCSFLASMFMIYIVGLIDDVVGLGANTKFLMQIVAASLLPACNLYINDLYGLFGLHAIPFWIGAPLTVFAIVYVDNAMNLIDGIDGLSGGLALIALAVFFACFFSGRVWVYCVMIAGLAGVLCAYLYFNIWGKVEKHRKIFMGDSGSLTIGFILSFLFVKVFMNNPHTLEFNELDKLMAYSVLIVPGFDVARVIMSRLRSGQSIFKADKRHIHHKLLRCGLSQHKALCAILLLQLALIGLNLLLNQCLKMPWIVLVDIIVFTAFNLAVSCVAAKSDAQKKKKR